VRYGAPPNEGRQRVRSGRPAVDGSRVGYALDRSLAPSRLGNLSAEANLVVQCDAGGPVVPPSGGLENVRFSAASRD
jgi:hypothetical protein